MESGVNAPPFHPYCRCTTCPYFDDMDGYRASRDEEGRTVYDIPANMTYSEWKKTFVKDSISDELRKSYSEFKNILGDNIVSIEEFSKIRYNRDEWKLFKNYTTSIKSGEITLLASFELYKRINNRVDKELLGKTTSNGILIKDKSAHSLARIIGSIEQRRNGVSVSDVLDALTSKTAEVLPVRTSKNGRSQKFKNKSVEVTINPETGNIIQMNPIHTRKKE